MTTAAALTRPRGAPDVSLPSARWVPSPGAVRATVCAAPALALFLLWSTRDGGYDTLSWLPGAIGLVVLSAWSWLAFGRARRLGRYARLALAALGLYAAWSYASVAWAVDKGSALIGSDRTLLYVVLFALFAGLEWTRRRLELALVAYLLGVGALAAAVLAELATAPAPHLLQGGQLAAGLGYHNATAALGTIGAAGSILLGSSRRRGPLVRAALAAGATACLLMALLAESRGWLFTLPVIAVMLLAIAPARARVAAWGLVPVGAALTTLPWVLHGWGLADAGRGVATVSADDTATALVGLLAALAAGAVALLLARAQERFTLAPRGRRVASAAARAAAAIVGIGAAGASALLVGGGALARGWHQFTAVAPVRSGGSRFAELGSGRYDFWRVALKSFLSHPLGGLGQDNFAQAYVAARRTGDEPLWVHSLELRLLAHTGAVGLVLFVAFVAFALVAVSRAVGSGDRRLRLALTAALVPLAVWVVHGSVDWLWELPALSGAVFAFLGAAVALEPKRDGFGAGQRARAVAAAAATVGALALLGSAYIGERALQGGRALALTNPTQALTRLHLAAQLEPLSSAPQALQAGIELRAGDGASALRLAAAGLSRDPGDWVLWLEDGLAAGATGRPVIERAALEHARALDPREPVIALAQRRAGTRHPVTVTEAASLLAARARVRVAP